MGSASPGIRLTRPPRREKRFADRPTGSARWTATRGGAVAKIESPRELFVSNLRSTLKMENDILDMLEELQEEARDSELKQNLVHHHEETQQQVRNLERAFEA